MARAAIPPQGATACTVAPDALAQRRELVARVRLLSRWIRCHAYRYACRKQIGVPPDRIFCSHTSSQFVPMVQNARQTCR